MQVDPVAKTITAQGGAVWKEVDEASATHGLATPGGAVSHTGIGGLTLGGGYGWLSGRHGLTLDNLIAATVALADGRIVECSESTESDLFWALRGAGYAFGAVVEFVYRAHEQGPVFGGVLGFPLSATDGIIEFANFLHANNNGDQAMTIGFTAPDPSSPAVFTGLFYNGTEDEARKYFKPLFDLAPFMEQVRAVTYPELQSMLDAGMAYGGRKIHGGSNFTLPMDKAALQEVTDAFFKIICTEEGANESSLVFECVPAEKVRAVPTSAMAFANRGDFYVIGMAWKWYNPELDSKFREHSRAITRLSAEKLGTRNPKEVGRYVNHVDVGERQARIFGQNQERLKELKLKYDPEDWFSKPHMLNISGLENGIGM